MENKNPHAIAGAGVEGVLPDASTHSKNLAKPPVSNRRYQAHVEVFDILSNLTRQIGALVRAMDHAPTDHDHAHLFDLLLRTSDEAETAVRDFLREVTNV